MAAMSVLYNGKMKKFLPLSKASGEEIAAIKRWTDYKSCQMIRDCFFFGEIEDIYSCNDARVIDSMFEKYDSFLDKNESIYRGIRFKNSDQKIFEEVVSNLECSLEMRTSIEIDKAPASFTREFDIAKEEFALVHDPNYRSLIFELVSREDGELFIKEYAGDFSYQDEIIIKSHKSLYEVLAIDKDGDTVYIKIKEVRDEKKNK